MTLAALSADHVDHDDDGLITVAEARAAIRVSSPVLAAAFAPLIDRPVLADAVQVELGALETLISAVDAQRVNRSADRRGDPWLYFYEDFLTVYDPEERRQAGVYFTPIDVVRAMTRMTDQILVERFGRRLGFADPQVVTLDPATGTGTFPLAVIESAVRRAVQARGPAGEPQAAANLSRNLHAFELLPGPYSVAHLRITQRLRALSSGEIGAARVVLTDTLESPLGGSDQHEFFGDAETLAQEQERARQVKLDQHVTVVIGNPPYRRVERQSEGRGTGGWVVDGRVPGRTDERSLFADIYDVANANTIFSHIANLYNLYVYFWRWALWKAFEAHGDGPGVVAFITGSSWLTGPGFIGLRQLVRELCDEAWVLDLGGDNRGAHPEENVFAIETPVAVVILVRDGATDRSRPAQIHYRRIRGTTEQKLTAMRELADSESPLTGEWIEPATDWFAPFVPSTGDAQWAALPLLSDIFPWQQPGCKFGRTWPIAPTIEMLEARWRSFAAAPISDKPDLFFTASSGRNIHTSVGRLGRLADTDAETEHQPISRYGYRSFDRQWAFQDPRLTNLERPSLWQSVSNQQIFMCSLLTGRISSGPALTVSAHVPDLHFYRGSYGGKDVIPLYRDASARVPNITAGFLDALATEIGIPSPSPEDMASYAYAILSSLAYQERFAGALETPGLRLPITTDADLWQEAVDLGGQLLWLHTYAERFQDPSRNQGTHVPQVEGVEWAQPVTTIPADPTAIVYDPDAQELRVGDGLISGVRSDVWDFSVTGMQVIQKWLGYRTSAPPGRASTSSSALDRMRPSDWPDEWNDELLDLVRVLTRTLDLQPLASDLLTRICDGPLVDSESLPTPSDRERKPPATEHAPTFDFG
ncbi:type ISP restriction/modification enzyme [Parablastomonas sp. CN1-191]|uniref:type ISP restriction/modification enzyme n=1 Tax=Parablastomonas sp. CN1-191 TaxID=3400908 RepID=UPI003BF83C3D